jgi:hypothetical protein
LLIWRGFSSGLPNFVFRLLIVAKALRKIEQ